MSAPEDPRIWQGLRAHLDDLGSVATAPPIGAILDRPRARPSFRAVAGLAAAVAIVIAIGLLLPGLLELNAPIIGVTPTSSSAPATPTATPTAAPVDGAELTGHSYVAIDVTENGKPIAIVPETRIWLRFEDASHFGAGAGCNGLTGWYEVRDGRFAIVGGAETLKACTKSGVMEQEGWYFTFLHSSPTISRDSRGLVLSTDDAVVTYVDGVPACTVEQLQAAAVDKGSNLGNGGILFTLHNRSSNACQLTGYPRLQLLGPNGRLLHTDSQEATDGAYLFPAIPANPIELSPGADASFQAAYAAIPSGSQADDPLEVACPTSGGARITLPGSQGSVDVRLQVAACGGWLSVSPVFSGSAWIGY